MRLEEFAKASRPKGWLVKGLIPQGHAILGVGLPGTLKSWFVDGLAVHIASGKDFLGLPVNQGAVVLVDEDTPSDELLNRLKRFAIGLNLSLEDLPIEVHSMENINLSDDESLQKLVNEVIRIKPGLVILDCLSKVMGGEFNENSTRDANIAGNAWNKLKSTGATVFSTHHLNKREGNIATDFVRLSSGSHAIVANSDTAFGIEFGQHDPTRFNAHPVERRCKLNIREPFGIELEEDTELTWARLKRVGFARRLSPLAKDIYEIFRAVGEGANLTANDVKRHLAGAASDSDMRSALSELEDRGFLRHKPTAHNRYEYYRV
jgi:hypothetical protein